MVVIEARRWLAVVGCALVLSVLVLHVWLLSGAAQREDEEVLRTVLDCGDEALLGCANASSFVTVETLSGGWAKVVQLQREQGSGRLVAVKRVNAGGHVVRTQGWQAAVRLLFVEANHLRQLRSEYVVALLGSCLESPERFSYWVEYLSGGTLAQQLERRAALSWPQRLQLAASFVRLLRYLERSPIGAVLIMDFKTSQFLVDPDRLLVKVSDVDTIRILPLDQPALDRGKPCTSDQHCSTYAFRSPEVRCTANATCLGYSPLSNMYHACRLALVPLLSERDPFRLNATANSARALLPVASFLQQSSNALASKEDTSKEDTSKDNTSKDNTSKDDNEKTFKMLLMSMFNRCLEATLSANEALTILRQLGELSISHDEQLLPYSLRNLSSI